MGRWQRRRITNALATALMTLSATAAVTVLLIILGHVVIQGLPSLNVAFFTERPLPPGEVGGGVAPAILGTLEMLGVAGLIGIPVGIATAIYLSEYGRGNLARAISFSVDLIAGLPSIAIGVFVWAWLVRNVVGQYNGLAGGVALAIIMIPILTRTVEETLRIVPDPLREASLALGIPRWKTFLRVVLPTAQAGVITAVVLSLARAGGETAPLPIQIYNYARSPYPDWQAKAWGGALVLITLIGVLSALTRWTIARRSRAH